MRAMESVVMPEIDTGRRGRNPEHGTPDRRPALGVRPGLARGQWAVANPKFLRIVWHTQTERGIGREKPTWR